MIVGRGIAGCSTAHHLSLMGERDLLRLEQRKLIGGTTWWGAAVSATAWEAWPPKR